MNRAERALLALGLALCVVLLVLALNMTTKKGPVVLVSNEAVEITQDGPETRILDALTGRVYKLTARRIKRTESPQEPYTVAQTDTMKIEIIPGGYRVQAGGMVYQFTYKRGGPQNGEKSDR